MPQQRYNFDQIRSDSEDERENGAGSDDEEEHEAGEIFADYRPSKLHIGMPHPDPVVETASLAAVEPPDITYELHIHVRHPLDIALECRNSANPLWETSSRLSKIHLNHTKVEHTKPTGCLCARRHGCRTLW